LVLRRRSEALTAKSTDTSPPRVPDLAQFTQDADFYAAEYWRARAEFKALPKEPWPTKQTEWDRIGAVVGPLYDRRVNATWGLVANGVTAVPHALEMVRSRDPDAREDGGGILGALGRNPQVVDELVAALDRETDTQARDTFIVALGRMRAKEALPALARFVRDWDGDGDTRWTAIQSLEKIARRRFDREEDPQQAAIAWLDSHGL
jgi:HEAT repeat protein